MNPQTTLHFVTAADSSSNRHLLADARQGALVWSLTTAPPEPLQSLLILTGESLGMSVRALGMSVREWPVQPLPAQGPAAMLDHVPYAVVSRCTDWTQGYAALVMTVKNDDIPHADYPLHLRAHVALVSELFVPMGLDGYLVYAGADYEWAFLHWPDQQTAQQAFSSPRGAEGPAHSRSFQHMLCAAEQLALPCCSRPLVG